MNGMKYLVDENCLVETIHEDGQVSLVLSSPSIKIECSTDGQSVAQLGMALLIDASEVGIDDIYSLSAMLHGMGEEAVDRMKQLFKQLLQEL